MTTPTTTANTLELDALFTSKATDIHAFVMNAIEESYITNFPDPDSVNKVFLSLPKANRDKTTYVLIYTMATLDSKGKLQSVLTKAIAAVADKDSRSFEKDKAVTKLISLVKAYITLGQELVNELSSSYKV